MKTSNFFKLIFCFILVTSCSSNNDNDEGSQNNDIVETIDEYPPSGTLISILTTNLTGNVTFSILSQTLQNAFIINGASMYVGDWLAYDYEANETLSAIIVATNGTDSETIDLTVNLNNIDDIWAFLSGDSKTAYENANAGEWVIVSASEYNNLANYLFDVNRSGQSEGLFNDNSSISVGGADYTVAINDAPTLSSNEYLYAFKYYCHQDATTGSNVKLSETSYQSDFLVKGDSLPIHDSGYNYFVLKGNNVPTVSNAYLAIYESNTIGFKTVSGETYFFESGDSTFISNDGGPNRGYLYQGLSTTLKQWD